MTSSRVLTAAVTGLAVLGLTAMIPAHADTPGYPVVPSVYDPGHSGGIISEWDTHVGEPDSGNADHGLVMDKNVATTVNAAAIATLERVKGTVWQDQLGFDYAPGSYCGAGAPRFDVYDATGAVHFFGCASGAKTVLPDGWTQVRFSGQDGFPAILPGTAISAIYIVMDEQGQATLDNIFYDGAVMGEPGA